MGVKGLSLNVFHVRIVKIISDERISQMLHMYPDLMSAAGFQTKRDKAVSVLFGYNFIVSDRRLSVFEIYGPFDDRSWFAGEGRRDRPGIGNNRSACDGEIFPADLMPANHFG